MSFAWMRRIDSWVGKPVLWFLRFFLRKAGALRGKHLPLEKLPSRIICSKFSGLGGIVLAFPLLMALKRRGVRIAFCSFEGQGDLAKIAGLADESWIIRPTWGGFLPSFFRTWWQARRFRAEAFLDLEEAFSFSAILAAWSGASYRIGFRSSSEPKNDSYSTVVSASDERHFIERNLEMARVLGVESDGKSAQLPPAPAFTDVRSLLPPFGGRTRVVLNINASEPGSQRTWPEESWIDVGNRFLADPAVDLVFVGSAEDRDRVQALLAKLRDPTRAFNFAGIAKLSETMKLLQEAQLAISIDSGFTQLAAWSGVPLVALYGPQSPRSASPRSPNVQVVWAGISCSPCLSSSADVSRCGDNVCMKSISSKRVFEISLAQMASSSRRAA